MACALATEPTRMSDNRRNDVRGPRGAVAWMYYSIRKKRRTFSGFQSERSNGTDWLGLGRATCAWGDSFATASKTLRTSLSVTCAHRPLRTRRPLIGCGHDERPRAVEPGEACDKSGETSLRAAAEDIAAAQEQGATQRQIAEAVGKSAAWVNQLLKWRHSSYRDVTPFGPQAKASRQRANRVQSPERKDQKPASTSGQARAAERRQQEDDHRTALQKICRQLEREKEEREQRYLDLCRSVGKEPEPFSPPLSPENEPPLSVAEDLEQALRVLLTARGFNLKADNIKRAIEEFVRAVLAQQQ